MKASIKPHELPVIPACIRMLCTSVIEQMQETEPDWEWVIANLIEAHEQATVAYLHAQEAGIDPES